MTRHIDGRTLAARTGWDVLLVFPAVGQERHRGSVMLCTHPKLPGWQVGRHGRQWVLANPLTETIIRFAYLWQAIEAGNRIIATGGEFKEVQP